MSKEDNKKELKIGDTWYGINNEIYTIENIDNEQIVIKFFRKVYLTYNVGNNQEIKIKEENLYFSFKDIGIKLFFKEGDGYKSTNELLDDVDYLNYLSNLNNRIENENLKEQERLQYIEALRPNARKITNKDIDLILSSYSDDEKNLKINYGGKSMETKKNELNERTKDLREVLEKAFKQEEIEYDSIHPSYNSRNNKNDDENLFITCYVVKKEPYDIHIDNRLELDKWVIDIVLMNPKLEPEVNEILENNGFKPEKYNGECNGEFEGHRKLLELNKDTSYDDIKDINLKLLRFF